MRSLLLAACLAASPSLRAGEPAAASIPAAADWRKAELPDGAKDALAANGYRFEDDGRVLDPETKKPLSSDQFLEAVTRLELGTQQLALERLRLILSKDKLSTADQEALQALKGNLPEAVAKAVEAGKSAAELRELADMDLARVSSYFDASRTLGDRRSAAQPVSAGAPGRRVSLSYFNESERLAGESLRAAVGRTVSKDAFGRTVVARLNGTDGKPDLPPIVVQDLGEGNAAVYDYRRRALVVDLAGLRMSVVEDAAPKDRAALSDSLASRQALVDYVAAHPEAAASLAAKNDALLVHELTHAWQDRRDPVMREMARGNLPQAMLMEYELEAWTIKNLYIHSRLKSDPAAKIDVFELNDYLAMQDRYVDWARDLKARYSAASLNVMDVATASALQKRRVADARARAVSTKDEQTAKSLDLVALTRAQRELQTTGATLTQRLKVLKEKDAAAAHSEGPTILAERYLASAITSPNAIEFSVNIMKAEDFARQSGDKRLIEKILARKEQGR